jgi:hypothetical protein
MTLLAPTADFSPARWISRRVAIRKPSYAGEAFRQIRSSQARFGWFCLLGILAAVVAARAFNVIPIPECRATPTRLAFDPMTEVKVTTSARTPCLLSLRLGTARVDALTITVDPQHGVVIPRGRTGVVYRPLSGFRGEDSFWFSLDGRANHNPGAAVVRVGVTVK